MAHRVFGVGLHLREGDVHALGDKNGIIAEAVIAARREGKMAMDLTDKSLHLAMRRAERQSAGEMRSIVGGGALPQFLLDPRHGDGEILDRSRPTRRIDA